MVVWVGVLANVVFYYWDWLVDWLLNVPATC